MADYTIIPKGVFSGKVVGNFLTRLLGIEKLTAEDLEAKAIALKEEEIAKMQAEKIEIESRLVEIDEKLTILNVK